MKEFLILISVDFINISYQSTYFVEKKENQSGKMEKAYIHDCEMHLL